MLHSNKLATLEVKLIDVLFRPSSCLHLNFQGEAAQTNLGSLTNSELAGVVTSMKLGGEPGRYSEYPQKLESPYYF